MGGGHSQNKGRRSMRQNLGAHILRMHLGSLVIARTVDTSKPLKMFHTLMHLRLGRANENLMYNNGSLMLHSYV
jgi:hypothetical protein